jgi:hypothetical protein
MTEPYAQRQAANDASRARAEHHNEIWEAYEIELLEEGWGEDTAVEEIAELLGRTIEACRQKHYDLGQAKLRARSTKQAKSSNNSQWDKGWSSLEDMGY